MMKTNPGRILDHVRSHTFLDISFDDATSVHTHILSFILLFGVFTLANRLISSLHITLWISILLIKALTQFFSKALNLEVCLYLFTTIFGFYPTFTISCYRYNIICLYLRGPSINDVTQI